MNAKLYTFHQITKLFKNFRRNADTKWVADVVITTTDTDYVFDFKLSGNGTAEDVLKQIADKGYFIPITAGNKRLVKVGAEFSTKVRGLSRWVVG